MATPTPGGAQSGRHTNFRPWNPLVGPIVCLTLVNAQGRVGTSTFKEFHALVERETRKKLQTMVESIVVLLKPIARCMASE